MDNTGDYKVCAKKGYKVQRINQNLYRVWKDGKYIRSFLGVMDSDKLMDLLK